MWYTRMFWQLFGAYGVLVLFSVSLLGMVVTRRAEKNEHQQIEESLRSQALLVHEAIRSQPARHKPALLNRLKKLEEKLGTRFTLISEEGQVLADSSEDPERMENHAQRPEVLQAGKNQYGSSQRYSSTLGQSMMYLALRVEKNSLGVAFVRVALPLTAVETRISQLHWLIWTAAGITAFVAMGLAAFLARRFARPLRQLTEGAEQITAGDYGHHVYVEGSAEVSKLARTFNHMSERLASQFTQLDEDRQQLRAVLGSMVEGVVALDQEQRVLFANERAGQLLDFSTAAAGGRRLWELVRQRGLQEIIQRALKELDFQQQELRWQGTMSRNLQIQIGRLPGQPIRGLVLVFHDISHVRRLERVRQEFVANASHELKTPLAVITACVETLIDGASTDLENRDRFLQRIAEQSARLQNLIHDLLSLARMESECETFVFQEISLEKAAAACLEQHRARAEGKKQELEAAPPPQGQPLAVTWADAEAVRQILDNLVDNALKYTPEGGTIRVGWGREKDEVFLTVQDTGIGIPPAELPRVFERFYRVDKARSRELGGTGLGLAIVKHLAQAMQGRVSAQSQPGRGSTFSVHLPAAIDYP